jgi:hypothetical protein
MSQFQSVPDVARGALVCPVRGLDQVRRLPIKIPLRQRNERKEQFDDVEQVAFRHVEKAFFVDKLEVTAEAQITIVTR